MSLIKKIRSYLLEDEDNKSSIGIYVSLLLLAPLFTIFWEYKKAKSTHIATISGINLEKSIFSLKVYEQRSFLDQLKHFLGEEQGENFYYQSSGGLSPEEFSFNNEIKRISLSFKFNSLFGSSNIVSMVLKNKFSENSDKLHSLVGPFVFMAISSPEKAKEHNFFNFLDMSVIDKYIMSAFSSHYMGSFFAVPLYGIERSCLSSYCNSFNGLVFNKLVYLKAKKKYLEIAKSSFLSEDSDKNNNEAISFYNDGLVKGLFKKNIKGLCKLLVYSPIGLAEEGNEENVYKNAYEAGVSSFGDSYDSIKSYFDKTFSLSREGLIDFSFDKKNSSISFVGNDTALEDGIVKNQLTSLLLESYHRENNFFSFLVDNHIYLFYNLHFSQEEDKSFSEAEEEVREAILELRAKDLCDKAIDEIRYGLEESNLVIDDGWTGKEIRYLKEDIDKEEKKFFVDIINRKLASGGIRKGASFVVEDDSEISIYYCTDVLPGEDFKTIGRKNDLLTISNCFSDLIQSKVKVEMNDSAL